MTTRTTQTLARFSSPFLLPGFDTPFPAGEYRVDHDEEQIEATSRLAWRRVLAMVHLPAMGTTGQSRQMVPVSPADFDAAIAKDQQQS